MSSTENETVIVLDYSEQTLAGLFATLLHAAKNDVTPVVCTVQVSAKDFIATDRYTVGRFTHTQDGDVDAGTILVPRSSAEWLAKQLPKTLGIEWIYNPRVATMKPGEGVQIVFTANSITIRHAGGEQPIIAVHSFGEVRGNFPPVARLFPDPDAAIVTPDLPVALNPDYLLRFIQGAKRLNERNETLSMLNTVTANPSKPGPILIQFGAFTGLLQPNLILR